MCAVIRRVGDGVIIYRWLRTRTLPLRIYRFFTNNMTCNIALGGHSGYGQTRPGQQQDARDVSKRYIATSRPDNHHGLHC